MKKLLFVLTAFAFALSAAPLKIAENGKALAGILVPEKAKPLTLLAAQELASYLNKMTGAKFTVGEKSSHKVNFKLGFGDASKFEMNEYVLRRQGNDIHIYGRDNDRPAQWFDIYHDNPWAGTLRAVYEFLDLQGIIWPNPGIEYVPQKKLLTVDDLNVRRKFEFFSFGGIATWNFMQYKDGKEYAGSVDDNYRWLIRNGFHAERFHLYGCHTEHYLGLSKDPKWLADPTHLMLDKNGVRVKRYSCWTHPDMVKVWIRAVDGYFSGKSALESGFKYIGRPPAKGYSKWPFPFVCPDEFMIDPMDNDGVNDGRCRCKRCEAFRKKNPCADDTEIIWDVIIKVAEYVHKKFPGKYITTLVYPPKTQLPKRTLPPNIKVRICLAGPKVLFQAPAVFKTDLEKIAAWHKITGNKVPLWGYHCINFGNAMPYLAEVYPRKIASYLKGIRKHSSGIYMETKTWNGAFTPANIDIYIMLRMLNNPDRDVEKELKRYFKAAYGPAASEAEQFFGGLERLFADFWSKTVDYNRKVNLSNPWGYNKYDIQRSLWSLSYTAKNLENLESLVKVMEKKAAGTIYAKQVRLLRRYMWDEIVAARKKLFADEDLRAKSVLRAVRVKGVPSAADWQNAPVLKLQSAERFSKAPVVPGTFRLLTDGKNIYCRAELQEPMLDRSLSRQKSNGSRDVWKDNVFELFFYSEADKTLRQIVANDLGAWSAFVLHRAKSSCKLLPGVKVVSKKEKRSWSVEMTIPVASISPKGGKLRFNAARERNIKGVKPEFSTWSELSKLGEWHNFYTFPDLILK